MNFQDYSELSSLYSATDTYTSSSTILGPGALTGKGIKKLGMAVISGLDSIIYRRRLARIEKIFRDGPGPGANLDAQDSMKSICDDLLELSRPVYSFSIRSRAFRLIMKTIASMEIEELASSVVYGPIAIAYQHLVDVLACLWDRNSDTATVRDTATEKQMAAFREAGYTAYTSLGRNSDTTRAVVCTAFVTYLALLAALGDTQFSRMLMELNVVDFLSDLDLDISSRERSEGVVCRLLLHILKEKLDPIHDSAACNSLSGLLGTLLPPAEHRHDQSPPDSLSVGGPSSVRSWTDGIDPPSDLLGMVYQVISSAKMPSMVPTVKQVSKKSEAKLLLLGTGDSGKTTMMKQLMIARLTASDRNEYVDLLLQDIFRTLYKLVDHACKYGAFWGKKLTPESYADLRYILDNVPSDPDAQLANLKHFVRDNVLDLSYMRQVLCDDTTDYFVDLLARILREGCLVPTDEDIIHNYVMTTGIHSETVSIQEKVYRVFDVGGQRSERRKWIHCFEGVSMVVLVVSLSEYDQVLYEDSSGNRTQDTTVVVDSICQSGWFKDGPIVLLLNKSDVLARKLSSSPLNAYFPDYTGGADHAAACDYFVKYYVSLSKGRKNLYVYITCATDGIHTRNLFEDIHQRVVQKAAVPFFEGLAYTSDDGFIQTNYLPSVASFPVPETAL